VTTPDGFEEFVRARSRALLRTAWLLTGDWASAEDLVQSALASAWPRWAALRSPDAPDAYVRKIMMTTFLRWQRRRWTGEISTGELPETVAPQDPFGGADLREVLRRALQTLTPSQRAVIALRCFLDLTETDTAAALGCSVGAVKGQSARALTRLRRIAELSDVLREGVPR
jgi:RNA polymerase sigma-70 factor (sigma-E family)